MIIIVTDPHEHITKANKIFKTFTQRFHPKKHTKAFGRLTFAYMESLVENRKN